MHKVLLDGISDNMASLLQLYKYGAIDAVNTTTMGYYVIKYLYGPCTTQEDQTKYWQVSNAGKHVVKYKYLSFIIANTNWYWQQHGTNQIVVISTRTINHICIEVSVIKNFVDIPRII